MELHVWKIIFISSTLMLKFAKCQRELHPSVSDILAGTSILEGAVMDLSSAAVTDFIQNAPSSPSGHRHGASTGSSHVDMPGEHGNQNDFPVVHREPAGGVPIGGVAGDGFVDAPILNSGDGFGPPVLSSAEVKPIGIPASVVPNGIFNGINVFDESGFPTNANNIDFIDLAALGDVPLQLGEPSLHSANLGKQVAPVAPPISKSDGFSGQVGTPVKPVVPLLPAKEVVVAPPAGDGFISDGFQPEVAPIDIADAVHDFEKSLSGGSVAPTLPVDGVPDLTPLKTSGASVSGSLGSVHVDLPGEHGNTGNAAVVHRDSASAMAHDHALMSVHVDLPGEHGNTGNTPVVHRGPLPVPAVPTHVGIAPNADHHPSSQGNVHVDLPGEHGNTANTPVVHREPHIGHVGPLGHDSAVHPVASPQIGLAAHVDLPGEHGNMANMPVVHRDHRPMLFPSTHVDLPGQHGNMAGAPVVHRDGVHSGILPAGPVPVGHAAIPGNVHVDLPGQHGNMAGAPVVHRDGVHSGILPAGPVPVGHAAIPGNVHVDLPGQHGNMAGAPVVHRDGVHSGILPAGPGPIGHAAIPGNVHVDHPGEHGNMAGVPVVHREHGGMPIGGAVPVMPVNTAVPLGTAQIGGGFPPHDILHPAGPAVGPHGGDHHGIHIDAPGEHGNPHNEPALHLPPGATVADAIASGVIPHPAEGGIPHGGVPGIHSKEVVPGGILPGVGVPPMKPHHDHKGIHIDAPGEHGNPHNEPALHLPPGATVDDAVASGVIPPHPHKPVVPTGVLPGTLNVPVKPNLHIGGGKGIFGPDSTGIGIVGGKNVLLGKGGRRRNRKNRRRGGRRGGRRCDRRGRCREVGGKNDPHDHHPHDHEHPSKPTPKPNSGIIVIRNSRPNPLGALANAVRGMLGSNGHGGGLLGSILRSASGAPGGPPRGVRIIGPAHPPQNLMHSVLGNLFGKR